MKTVKKSASSANSDSFKFSKKISGTVYNVTAHYSQTSKETIEDKMFRLIENEAIKSA